MPLTVNPGDVQLISGTYDTANAGAIISAGQVLTQNASRLFVLADVDTVDLYGNNGLWIALNTAAGTGQPVTAAKSGSVIDLGQTGIDGDPFYLGDGGLIHTPSEVTSGVDYLVFLGYGNSSDNFVFSPVITSVLAGSVIA